MSSGEEEYEVEAIFEAKVEKAKGKSRNPKLLWKYRVRWKGYSAEDDTWEPIESFHGSEHIVSAFWERANVGGRDVDDMTQFKAGEIFRPVGPPPRKKRKRLSSTPEVSKNSSIADLDVASLQPRSPENHVRDLPHEDLPPPLKRLREEEKPTSLPSSPLLPSSVTRPVRSQGRRPPSPEVIPDSDEETDRIQAYLSPTHRQREVVVSQPSEVVEVLDADEPFDPLFDEPKIKIPEHISRRENPLVKMVDVGVMNLPGAIAAKVRAVHGPNVGSSSQAPPRVKPGPGRSSGGLLMKQKAKSSLLTAEKGAIKIIKGKYRKEDATLKDQELSSTLLPGVGSLSTARKEDANQAVPSGDELLQLAGLDQTAADLADFEDPKPDDSVPVGNNLATETVVQPVQTSLELTGSKDSPTFGSSRIFPQPGLSPVTTPTNVFGKMHSWNQSTIFGPLSLGSDSTSKRQQHEFPHIFLNLDSAVSIPAGFVNAPGSNSAMPTLMGGSKGTPGKFYGKEAALTLLSTLRANGLTAHVIIDDSATVEEREHFTHFASRLQMGDIFVAMADIHTLVFCSSDNGLLSQRLNISPAFQNIPNCILVSKVDVENYSGYADATSQADERRWIQYVAALS